MTATESTANNKNNPEKKPGADHATDSKSVDNAAALAKKLHDDSHQPSPKSANKPQPPKSADSIHSVLGWLSSTEKSAEDAVKNAATIIKADLKSAVKAVSTAAAAGDKALEHFGSLTLFSTGASQKHDNSDEPHHEKARAESAKKADADSKPVKPVVPATAGSEAAAATIAGKPPADLASSSGTGNAGTTGATDSIAAAAPAGATTSLLGGALNSIETTLGSAVKTAESAVKDGLEYFMSADTAASLQEAATTYGSAVLTAGGAALPGLVGLAGAAYSGYKHIFASGTGDFKQTAEKVDSFKDVTYESLGKNDDAVSKARGASDFEFAQAAAKKLGLDWIVPGSGQPGGGAEIARSGNSTLAMGKTIDGIDVKVSSTAEKQEGTTGAIDVKHTAEGTTLSNADYNVKVDGDLRTIIDHDGSRKIVFNIKNKTTMIIDNKLHTNLVIDKNGVESNIAGVQALQAKAGMPGLKDNLPQGVTVRYAITPDGEMGAFTSDHTSYIFSDKTKLLTVEKDDYRLQLNVANGQAKLYRKDPKTGAYVLTQPDASTLPKGWKIHGNSVEINGGKLKEAGKDILHLVGAELDLKSLRMKFASLKGPMELSATNQETTLSGTAIATVKVASDGKVKIEEAGEPPVIIDTKANTVVAQNKDGSSAKIAADGGVQLLDGKSQQLAVVDAKGNETTFDAHHHEIFSINNKGDIHLYDGTTILHTGAVQNVSRGIDEPSYNGKTADQVVREAATVASSLGSLMGGSIDSNIASLEAVLSLLNSLGDVPGLAEQIGSAKGNVEGKIAQAREKENLNNQLAQAGKDSATIERAFAMRGSGISDSEIAQRILQPQTNHPVMANV